MPTTSVSSSEKLEGLQIARALAALSIAYYHSWHVTMQFPPGTAHPIPWLRDHGSLAVEFFFSISGFVICLLVTSPSFELRSFIVQRIFRIWPLWIATSFVFLYLTRYLGRSETQTIPAFFYSLTLLPTDGYPFYNVGWSLQHEIAFYVLAATFVPRFGILALAGMLALCALADNLLALPWYLHQYFNYYPYFLSGIAAFLLRPFIRTAGVIIPIAAGAALLWLEVPHAALPLLLTGFLNLEPSTQIGRLFVSLGDASFSIYLLHPLVFYCVYIHLAPPLPPSWTQEPMRYGALSVICLLSLATWRFFEKPIIMFARRIPISRRASIKV